MKVWLNGQLVGSEDATLSVLDHGVLYGDGVFEGIRAYGGKVFQMDAHLDRLFVSADAIRLTIPYSREELASATFASMEANGLVDSYIRMVITRGIGTLGLNPVKCPRPSAYVIADRIAMYSEEQYRVGMPVIIAKTTRTPARCLSPRVKSLNYLNNILGKIECIDAGVDEAIMLNDHGEVAEGTGDNVFIVEKGRLITPPPDASILLGITRATVLYLAQKRGIETAEETILPERLLAADECFLTGTGAEIIAATSVDGKPIGTGRVGPMTEALLGDYRAFILTDEKVPYTA